MTPIEFGHKVFLAESARGLITQYEVLESVCRLNMVVIAGTPETAFGDVPEIIWIGSWLL